MSLTVEIRRVRACSTFVEPKKGPRKFCATCGFTKLLHPRPQKRRGA